VSAARPDPFTLPEWQALHREASLVSQIIGSGATALGRASYADGFGEYYTAFFGLSIGIERLAKLILIADYAVENGAKLPNQNVVKKFGHKLSVLIEKADQIATKHSLTLEYAKPTDPICWATIECLDAFADASKGRYANFEAIGNPAFDPNNEPVNRWWVKVIEPILDKHYRGRAAEAQVRHNAKSMAEVIGNAISVQYFDEQGKPMTDIATASERTGQTELARKYGRFYTLSIVRWLADIFDELTHTAGYTETLAVLCGHYEFFSTYLNPNNFLLTRKRWPI
jgi:hypothetical protein